jgi:hypothetical protein
MFLPPEVVSEKIFEIFFTWMENQILVKKIEFWQKLKFWSKNQILPKIKFFL